LVAGAAKTVAVNVAAQTGAPAISLGDSPATLVDYVGQTGAAIIQQASLNATNGDGTKTPITLASLATAAAQTALTGGDLSGQLGVQAGRTLVTLVSDYRS
jgi:hypothetical protein